jgi:uncharacterized membrane protein
MLIGLLLLLPDLSHPVDLGREAVSAFRGRIVDILPARNDPSTGLPPVPIARVVVLDGDRAGQTLEAYLSGPGGSQSIAGYGPGDEVVVTVTDSADGSEPFIAVSDRWRIPWLALLGAFFALVVVAVGGWRGARALVALGLTIAVILKILLPLVIDGVAPLPLAVIAASAVTVATILLTEGWQRSSVAAILGTTGALALTGLLGAAVTSVMGFTYTQGSDLAFLTTSGGNGLDLRGLLLAAFILGAAGVLDDVTVTQAVLVDELADKGGLHGRPLFLSAMGVGRSHIGATINTLFLAYAGASLPLLVVLLVSRQPAALVLNDEEIATEIVRTLVGSVGIVAAVPFTTFVASILATASVRPRAGQPDPRPVAIAGIGAVVGALLVATIVLPLTSGSRAALSPPVFDPGASFPSGSSAPGLAASGSADFGSELPAESGSELPSTELPSSEPLEPAIAERGQPLPLTVDGAQQGTVTVVRWAVTPTRPGPAGQTIRISLRYHATSALDLTAGTWELLLADGTELPLEADGTPGLAGSLAAGESRDVSLVGDLPKTKDTPFLVYLDEATGAFPFAIPID